MTRDRMSQAIAVNLNVACGHVITVIGLQKTIDPIVLKSQDAISAKCSRRDTFPSS
jgi:hypothetical protein